MKRALNIALRTVHISAMGVLLGGYAFHVASGGLTVALGLTVGSGLALAAVEAGPGLTWFHEGRGLMTLVKLGLLCAVPFVRDQRFPLLLAVVVVASVGSHMPGRFRHYSWLYRRNLRERPGRGGAGPGP
jgi:hypothetical protein